MISEYKWLVKLTGKHASKETLEWFTIEEKTTAMMLADSKEIMPRLKSKLEDLKRWELDVTSVVSAHPQAHLLGDAMVNFFLNRHARPDYEFRINNRLTIRDEIQKLENTIAKINTYKGRGKKKENYFNFQNKILLARDVSILTYAQSKGVEVNRDFARCPFHGDDTPSCRIGGRRGNSYHCFGCGATGDVIDFCMKIENCSFKDAVNILVT